MKLFDTTEGILSDEHIELHRSVSIDEVTDSGDVTLVCERAIHQTVVRTSASVLASLTFSSFFIPPKVLFNALITSSLSGYCD